MIDPTPDKDDDAKALDAEYFAETAYRAFMDGTLDFAAMAEFAPQSKRPWRRPRLPRVSPKRIAGGFYRTVGNTLGGVPLLTMEDAVTSAVRMAYKVASAQVERSSRLARRLRDAGDRAVGPDSDRQALDATERLVFRTMMGGLTWLEAAAAERDSPLKRLLAAEYGLLGSLLGLGAASPPVTKDESTSTDEATAGRSARYADEKAATGSAMERSVKIVHAKPPFRPVRIGAIEFGEVAPAGYGLMFYSVERVQSKPIAAELLVRAKRDITLTLATPIRAPTGRWQAAITDVNRRQVGFIEILL
jgi:hypothetical protein